MRASRSLTLQHRVVAQVGHVVAAVRRQQVHDHRQVGRALDRGDAEPAHFLGQARLGLRDAVLHQLLRLVGVGAELEGDGQRHQAVGGRLAAHVEHVLDAVDLLLERRRHRLGDHLRVGARDTARARRPTAARPRDTPRSAARAARSGRPRKISTESTPAKIGRSMKNLERFMAFPRRCRRFSDWQPRRRCAPAALGLARPSRTACGATSAPGRMRCRPLTTTRSPAFRPAGDDAQAVDLRAERDLAVLGLVVGADHHHELLVLVGADRALVDQQRRLGLAPGPCAGARTGRASALPSALSNTARTRTVPLFASTWLSISCSWPWNGVPSLVAVPICTGMRSICARALAPLGSSRSARATTCSSASKLA